MATSTCDDSASDQADSKLFVAAIDVGTSFSGWAFASISDLEKAKGTNIHVKPWYSTYTSCSTGKTSTCVLIKPDGETLDSFGYEAERRYNELLSKDQHEKYFFFKNFKTSLYGKYNQPLSTELKLVDQMEKELPAIKVFSVSIRFLAEDMFTDLKRRFQDIRPGDIRWVVTVPAIWTDQAKNLMRKSALQAGLSSDSISIALEPEAASVYCRQLDVCAVNRDSGVTLSSLTIGSKYLVLDAGGGTIDLTIHEIAPSNCVKQVVVSSGNIFGGNAVNKEFEKFLKTALSDEKYEQFKQSETEDWVFLMGEFEVKKKSFHPDNAHRVNMRFPLSLKDIYESNKRNSFLRIVKKTKSIEKAFNRTDFGEDIIIKRDKISFPSDVFVKFFGPATDMTIQQIKKVIRKIHGGTISCILMVGGFSECILLQQLVKSEFPHIPVIVPVEASTAVLQGAVLYGYYPPVVSERVLKYSYGISGSTKFIPDKHPIEKRLVIDSGVQCKDIFHKHVTRGDSIKFDMQHKEWYFPQYRNQKKVHFYICASKLLNPRFTTDKDCHVIGKIILNLSGSRGMSNNPLEVTFMFGGTEITVIAEEAKTRRHVKTVVSFLE
ncbi:heat shock 70 kDa protein 12A-like [Ruditapes philippinarum]|uniref:heat shock 70 kDa protein 12A-like n=1 Tax=Ruditapes philippinarum TaxID=129788 RepID=UPI00295AD542|nr:heat shock 70 kDa protein 12A-like [Ruditapes philippinarum]